MKSLRARPMRRCVSHDTPALVPCRRSLLSKCMTFQQALENEKSRDAMMSPELKIVVFTATNPDEFEAALNYEEGGGGGDESTREYFERRIGAFLFR